MTGNGQDYYSILKNLKEKIRFVRQQAVTIVSSHLLAVYWEIGNIILKQEKAEGWGTKVIDRLATDLKTEFPDFKGLSARNLRYMKKFAEVWPSPIILQPVAAKLQEIKNQSITDFQSLITGIPWTHHTILLDKTTTQEERLFYLRKTIENGWSKSMLTIQIYNQLHLRQGHAINNFEQTLPESQSDLARESLKNPYFFDFLGISEEVKERDLEKALILHIKKFMLELGRGFAYVGNQYNLIVGDNDYFLDLLFYNYHMNCFVVFELKVGDFKPEYTGKLNFYINSIDEKIRTSQHKPTIGILLCKTPNETVVKYALKGIDTPMGVAEYELTTTLPKQLKGEMPTIEELEQELQKETTDFDEKKLSPVETRLLAIKEKLRAIRTEELRMPVSYSILLNLYKEGLKPLYLEIIRRLSVFDDDFISKKISWRGDQFRTHELDQFDEVWENEAKLRSMRQLEFSYYLLGFKKAGLENYDEYLTLGFIIEDYCYGFTLHNHNNQQPFFKKLYHQGLTEEDRQYIVEVMLNKVLDRMEQTIQGLEKS